MTNTGTRTTRPRLVLTYIGSTACAIAAPGNTLTTGTADFCTGSTITLSTQQAAETGLTYQWQSSPNNVTYTDVTGATSPTLALLPAAAIWYQCVVTCNADAGNPVASTPLQVSVAANPVAYLAYNGVSYVQNFEAWVNACGTTDIPGASWKNTPATGNNSWRRNDLGASAGWSYLPGGAYSPTFSSGAYSAAFHTYGAPGASQGSLDLYLDMSAGSGTDVLSFDHINPTGTDVLDVSYSTNGGTSFTALGTPLGAVASWTPHEFTINSTSATTIIRFKCTSDFGNDDIGVDNLSLAPPAACQKPTLPIATNITTTTADLSWTASPSDPLNGYIWEIRSSGAAGDPSPDATGTTGYGVTSVIGASTLVANTAYVLYVQSDCGGLSPWSNGYSFHTPCNAATVPYSENFDLAVTPALPSCWSRETIAGNDWESFLASTYALPFTGNVAMYGYDPANNANSWLFTQPLSLVGGTSYRLSYQYGNDGGTYYPEAMDVWYGTGATSASMTDLLFDHPSISGVGNATNTLDFTPATNGDYTIGFHAKSLANMDILVLDEISVIESPACVAPTALALTGSTTTTADFSWTASASVPVNGYEWEVRTSGLPGTGGEDDLGTDPTSTLTASATGLSASSSYKFYVRSLCVGGPSDWAGPFNFNTVCGTVTAPYTQNFDAVASLPNCWVNQGTGENWGFLPSLAPPGPDYGVNGAADHSGSGNYAWIDGSGGILANGLESVDVDFSSLTNPQVSFWMLSNNVDDAAINPIRLDAWDGAVWTPLATFSGNDPNWVERTAAIPGSIPTTSRFRLVALQSPTGSAFYNDLLVDDFSVMETPNCLPPTALSVTNITATTADLSWTASVSDPANGYVWEIRSDGLPAGNPSPDVSGTTAYGVTTVVGATPLVANTTYKLYVRGDCDVDGFSTWAQTTFFTGYCQATSTSTAYEIGSFSTTGGFLNISNLNSGFSTNGYGDFTSLVVSQMAEGTVNFAADYPGDTYRSSIWVDWNNDLDFNDVGEQVFLNAGYTSSDAGSFDVPTGQADGDYRMRIRTDWLNAPVACGTGTYYGETEDYTFRVETPTCIAPVATVTSLTGGTTATIDWMNNASFSYNWELRATGNPGDPAPIASGYHVGNGPAIIGGLTPGGQYYFYLQGWCNAADSSYWSTTSVYMGYCAAGSDDDATTNIKIAQVTFADVDNATSSTLGYDDQTAVVGHVQAGAFYPIAIAVQDGYDADRIRVWIDFNHDLVFSGSELVATGANPPANVGPNGYTVNTNFHMSAHALAGTTRMRIRLDNTINGPQNSPCGNSGFGQVEDYTLDVTAAPCTAPTATATPVPDCGNFQFTVNVDVTSVGDAPGNVTVDDDQGSAQQNGPTGTYTFGPYPNGTNVTYLVSFGTALCDEYVSTTYACTPTNQACGSAQGLTVYPENGCVMTNGSTFNASTEPMTGSGCVNNVLTLPTVYYSFVATGFAQNITLNFASGSFNASVFDACGGNELSCSGFNSGTTLVSGLTLNNTYYVRVASTGTGNFTLCVSESSVQPVSNDDCANADPVTLSAYGACTPTIGQLLGATHSAQANPSCVNPTLGTADVFYSFVANGDRQIITMSQDSTNKVYMLAAYNGCGGTQLLCKLIGPTFDALGTEYMVTGLTANNTYIVRVLCRPAEAGPFALCVMDPPPPVQVNCGGAVVDEFYQPVDNDNQYWAYHSNGTGAFTLTFNSGDIESFTWDKLTIRDGVDGNAPILYQNPSAQTDLTGVTVTATGSDLFMTLTTDGSVTPTLFDWTVQCAYHPGQACNANPVDCGLTYPGLTTGLGHNMPANACPFNGPASTGGAEWFVYTAASDQAVTVSTCGQAGFDTRISVFSGADCNNLTCLGMMDDSPGCPGGSSTLTFNTVTNNSYWIAVSGSGAQEGSYSLSLICSPVCTPPGNDLCGSATGVNNTVADGTGMPTEYTNVCATVDAPTTCSGTLPVQGVWFTFNTGNFDHTLITLLDNDEDNQYSASTLNYALYSGLCDGLGATNSVSCVVDAGGINVENVTQNTWYRLLVYNTGGSGISGTFGLLVEHPAHNDASITAILDPAPGLLCGTTMAPQVTLLNNGDNNLTSVQITYGLSLGIPYVHNWTGNLAYGASANVTLPTVPAQAGPAQTLSISTSLPNGVADDIPANDGQNVAVDVGGEALVVVIQNDANDGSGLYWGDL
ncbi:MAG: fibronectin type III domain-containing protein [Flavobacteriales bacterium]|nr:fibronectin type III domain-containing protein [Flavobacteriales bacterium]